MSKRCYVIDTDKSISQELTIKATILRCDSGVESFPEAIGPGSSRQGCESWRVKVLLPSVAQNGRLAYPLLGEVTDRDMRGRKSHGRPVYYRNSGGSNLGGEQIYGPEDKQIIAASKDTHTEVAVWI